MVSPARPSGAFRPGAVFGRYQIVRRIGKGGMGEVYEAVHTALEKRVALKILRHTILLDDQVRARFLREGRAAAKIRHPNVVDIFDFGVDGGTAFLVMELLEGEDLGSRLDSGERLPVDAAVDIVLPVLGALATAHAAGVIHRDLKPENIFLAVEPHSRLQPKVLDFGISKITDSAEDLTGTLVVMGTPAYMPPEQLRGQAKNVDGRADQYAMGVILYRCLTGVLPFRADTPIALADRILRADITPPRSLCPDLPPEVDAAVLRALAAEPDRRFPGVLAFGAALLPFASETGRALWGGTFENVDLAATLDPSDIDPQVARTLPDPEARPPQPPASDASTDSEPPRAESAAPGLATTAPAGKKAAPPAGPARTVGPADSLDETLRRPPREQPAPAPERQPRRLFPIVLGVVALSLGAAVVPLLVPGSSSERDDDVVEAASRPAPAATAPRALEGPDAAGATTPDEDEAPEPPGGDTDPPSAETERPGGEAAPPPAGETPAPGDETEEPAADPATGSGRDRRPGRGRRPGRPPTTHNEAPILR